MKHPGVPAPRVPRRLPELGDHYLVNEERRKLMQKYGDLTGGGQVSQSLVQASELRRVSAAQSIAAATAVTGHDDTEYITKREHALQMAQMDERLAQLREELRKREQAHDELARLVQQLIARGGVGGGDEQLMGRSYRSHGLGDQNPLLPPHGDAGGFNGDVGAGPEVDPSQSTGAGGLPVVVPMLDLGGNLPAFPGAPGGHHPHAGASPDDEVRRPAGICPDGFCRARGAIKEVERGWGEGRPTPVTPETSCVQEPGPGWRRCSPHPLSTLL